jgi:hypothetical protein
MNAAFDAKLNKKYADMIASVKKRERKTSSANAERCVPAVQNDCIDQKSDFSTSVDPDNGGRQCTLSLSRQQAAGVNNPGGMDNDALSPSVFTDSDKTIETQQKVHNLNRGEQSSSPLGSNNIIASRHTLSTKLRPSKRSNSHSAVAASFATTTTSRISSLGPWICDMCTFENLRNITRNSRCEMCDSVRPKELVSDYLKARDMEVVNIDC